ncbi:MAG TPA: TonB-dependent receptor [Candidatus Limnocylindrales bacterium]|nr:TonB-dependent receptor [Candidatus Limnocylindrales bacterium]
MRKTTLLLVLLCPLFLRAQAGSADLTGQVLDASGAAIPNARITLTGMETGVSMTTTSTSEGIYEFSGVRPGAYKLAVQAHGFSRSEQSGIVLHTGDRARVDPRLAVGSAHEVVVVSADAPLLQAESGSLRQVITREKIQNIPLNGRNFVTLATLAPGVALPPGTLLPRINGGRPRTNEYLFDGITALLPEPGQVVFFPVVDAIQEFSVESNSVPAQFGRFNGGVVNLSTRAGTNNFHGSAFEFVRNEAFNARDFFAPANQRKPEFRRNQFGATLGGPLARNRTFFFADYQGSRQAIGVTRISTVPTLLQRQGIFTEPINGKVVPIFDPATTAPDGSGGFTRAQFTNNTVPSGRLDPVAMAVLNRYPLPNLPGTANNFVRVASDQDNQDQFDLRLDHHFGERDQFFSRYSIFHDNANPAAPLPDGSGKIATVSGGTGAPGPTDTLGQQFVGSYTHEFDAFKLNELRLGYTRRGVTRTGVVLGAPASQALSLPGIPENANFTDALPSFNITGIQTIGSTASTFLHSRTDVTELVDNFSWQKGKHSLKFGGDFRWERLDIFQPPNPAGTFQFTQLFTDLPGTTATGNALASFLLGQVQQFQFDFQGNTMRPRAHIAELFVQDDWKVTRRLTVNAGTRYTLNFPSTEVDNQGAVFNLTTRKLDFLGQNGFPKSARELHWLDFGPRAGISYLATSRTVVRGGYGMVWIEQAGITTPFTAPQFPFLQTVSQRTLNNITPAFQLSAGPTVAPIPLTPDAGLGQGVFAVNRGLGSGYVQQWNVAVEHQISKNVSLEFGYAGNHIVHLGLPDVNINQLTPDQLAQGNTLLQSVPNPFFGILPASSSLGGPTITKAQLLKPFPEFTNVALYRNNVGSSHYEAFEARLEQRMSHGLSYLISYTHSKLIDEASSVFDASVLTGPVANFPVANSFDLRRERDSSSGDLPNVLSASYTWNLPVHVSGWVGTLTDGWQIAGVISIQSGLPLAITQATNFNAFAGYGVQRPNLNGEPNLSPGQRSPAHFFNTAAFSVAPQFTLGSSSRNPVRGPAFRNGDIAFIKNSKLKEGINLQLRTEIFNLTNTPAFAQPNGGLGSPGFGSISSTITNPRVVQLGAKVVF